LRAILPGALSAGDRLKLAECLIRFSLDRRVNSNEAAKEKDLANDVCRKVFNGELINSPLELQLVEKLFITKEG